MPKPRSGLNPALRQAFQRLSAVSNKDAQLLCLWALPVSPAALNTPAGPPSLPHCALSLPLWKTIPAKSFSSANLSPCHEAQDSLTGHGRSGHPQSPTPLWSPAGHVGRISRLRVFPRILTLSQPSSLRAGGCFLTFPWASHRMLSGAWLEPAVSQRPFCSLPCSWLC